MVFVRSLHVHEDDGVCSLFVHDADDGVCPLHVLEDDDLVCIPILEDGVCSLLGTFTFLSEAFLSGHAYTGKQQGVTNTLALPINKILYIYLLCPHSEHQKTCVPN
jgi:hypothetical protein